MQNYFYLSCEKSSNNCIYISTNIACLIGNLLVACRRRMKGQPYGSDTSSTRTEGSLFFLQPEAAALIGLNANSIGVKSALCIFVSNRQIWRFSKPKCIGHSV